MSKKVTLLAALAVVVSGLLFTGCTKKPNLDLTGLPLVDKPNPKVEDNNEVLVDATGDPLNGPKGQKGGEFVPGEGGNMGPGGIGSGQGGLGGPVDGKGLAGKENDPGTGWETTDKPAMDVVGGGGVADYQNGGTRLSSDYTVYFAYNQSDIPASERPKLDTLAGYLTQNPTLHATVEGHTDSRGSEKYNRALGERRALAVKNYLATMGVDAGRIQTISFGEDKPAVADAKSEAEFKLNRRAEFVVGIPVKR